MIEMAFKYINPGYGAWTGNSGVTTYESFTYNPIHGVSFYKYNSTTVVPTPQRFTTDFYCKFNYHAAGFSNSSSRVPIIGVVMEYDSYTYVYDRMITYGIDSSRHLTLSISSSTGGTGTEKMPLYGSINSVWVHLARDNTNQINTLEAIFNGVYDRIVYNTSTKSDQREYTFSDYKGFVIRFPAYDSYISELIVSDEYISPKEQIISVPISATETNMTAGASGIYIADAPNQTLLQTPNLSAMIENYGASSQITGIQVVGNPAYKTEIGAMTLTGITKSGASIAEHHSCELGTASTAVVADSWTLENTTLAGLSGMQFGWKTGW